MKESEKVYTAKVVGETNNNQIVKCYVVANDFNNTIENQLINKKKELIDRGIVFKKTV